MNPCAFPQAAPQPGGLHGKVVDGTSKEGIRKATVFLTAMPAGNPSGNNVRAGNFTPPAVYSAITDDSGVYAVAGLAAGAYALRAEKAGYLFEFTGGGRATVKPGENTEAPELKMTRHATLSGRVTDIDGEPLENVSVRALPASTRRASFAGSGGQAMTDDRGMFRIPRLAPGAFFLLASKNVHNAGTVILAGGQAPAVESPTFYPNARDSASAVKVTVGSGEERTGLEIRMQKSPAVPVHGRVTGDGLRDRPASVSLLPLRPAGRRPNAMWESTSWSAMTNPEGGFLFRNVLPGDYVAVANQGQASARAQVRVGETEVEGLELVLAPPVTITGRATADGGGKLTGGNFGVNIRALDGIRSSGGGGTVAADGSFTIQNLHRGRMEVLNLAPSGWYLKSVLVGGQPQPGFAFDVTGDMTIDLVYSNKPGAVEGTVEGTEGVRIAAALPRGPAGAAPFTTLYRSAMIPDGKNTFKIESVTPGEYEIVVASVGLIDALADQPVWEKVKTKAVSVKVEEGVTAQAAPRLITDTDVDEN